MEVRSLMERLTEVAGILIRIHNVAPHLQQKTRSLHNATVEMVVKRLLLACLTPPGMSARIPERRSPVSGWKVGRWRSGYWRRCKTEPETGRNQTLWQKRRKHSAVRE